MVPMNFSRKTMKSTIGVTLISLCLIASGQLRGEERFSISDGKTEAAVDAGVASSR